MKKNLLLLTFALALGAAAWWTFQRNSQRSTIEKLDLNFAIPDTASINKIVITSSFVSQVTMERQASGPWKMNTHFEVSPPLMELLLATLRNVEMKRPVEGEEKKAVNKAMKNRYRKVEVYVKGELYKTLLVGDDAHQNLGTYIKLSGGDPYVCHLRGFNGFLTPRFDVRISEWRHKLLFSSTPQTHQSIEVKYPRDRGSDFKIKFEGKKFAIVGAARLDTQATVTYLFRFKKVYLERFMPQMAPKTKDSLLSLTPEPVAYPCAWTSVGPAWSIVSEAV